MKVRLVVYSVVKLTNAFIWNIGALLPPMLWHVAGTSEGHYYRIEHKKPIFLHTHSAAPFLPLDGHSADSLSNGVSLTIHSSGECGVSKLHLTIDWWNSFGRWGARYWSAVLAWGASIIGFLFGWSLLRWDWKGVLSIS